MAGRSLEEEGASQVRKVQPRMVRNDQDYGEEGATERAIGKERPRELHGR
jgi:hypothetical protein